jgi:hypothetical protein
MSAKEKEDNFIEHPRLFVFQTLRKGIEKEKREKEGEKREREKDSQQKQMINSIHSPSLHSTLH